MNDGQGTSKGKYCPHCCVTLPKSTYYRHRRLYYDVKSQCWRGMQCEISEEWMNELEDNEQGEEPMVEETWNPDDNDFDFSDNGSNQPDEVDRFDCGL